MPPSIFYGRQPLTFTTFEYGPDGRITKQVTRSEPHWTPEDRQAVIALVEDEQNRCRDCGHPLDECLEGSDHQQGYVIGEVVCNACKALEKYQVKHQTVPQGAEPRKEDRRAWVKPRIYTEAQARAIAEEARHKPTE